MEREKASRTQRLVWSIRFFLQLFNDFQIGELFIRLGIFALCVIIAHTIMVFMVYNIAIPLLKKWFQDRLLYEMELRLANFEWNGHKLSEYKI